MKKTITGILGMTLFVGGAYAQGTVGFLNINAAAGVNAPVYLSDQTTKLTGPAWMAGLWAGPTSTTLAQIATTTFLTGSGAGYFQGGVQSIPTVPGGGTAWIRVTAWDSTLNGTTTGATWPQALASPFNCCGESGLFTVVTGDPTASPPGLPAPLVGLHSFAIFPEPSALSLSGLGLAALLLFRRRK